MIKLTDKFENPVYIQPERVTMLTPCRFPFKGSLHDGTEIRLDCGDAVTVEVIEKVETVLFAVGNKFVIKGMLEAIKGCTEAADNFFEACDKMFGK